MKNVVLIDFTEESIHALEYAADFTKLMEGELEIVNVARNDKNVESGKKLLALSKQYSGEGLEIKVTELIGELEEALTKFINQQKIGFVFCGTHEIKFLERFFSSRVLNLMNSIEANFVFIPHNLDTYKPVKQVLLPIFSDKHSLQNIEALSFLNHFMKFEIKLVTSSITSQDVRNNLVIATKLLEKAGLPFSVDTFGQSEDDLRKGMADLAKLTKSDLISIVNLTDQNLFNFGAKGFVEGLIRNEQGLPVLVIQHQFTEHYSGFHTAGGY